MALPPTGNPDVFMREVDDAVRADRMQSFATNYGKPLIAAIVVALAALGGWLFWQHRSDQSTGDVGREFSTALDDFGQNRPKAAIEAAEPLAKGDNPTYRALALMLQGDAAASKGDTRVAIARFGAVAGDEAVDKALRDTALLRQTLVEFDTMEPAAIINRLRGLVAQPGPAFASAAELTALAEMRRGNDAAAGALFKRISEAENVPESLKSRAVQMAGMLGVDAVRQTADGATTRGPEETKTGE